VIILLHGPPQCGKDTAKKIIDDAVLTKMGYYRFGQPMKDFLKYVLKVPPATLKLMLEEEKDIPNEMLNGWTPRWVQTEIFMFMSGLFGPEILGTIAADAIADMPYSRFIIDAGREIEVAQLTKTYGNKLVKAISITRPGCSFEGDSREDINFERLGIECITIHNQYDLDMYEIQIRRAISKWVSLKEN
jgi:hypothetical protein